LAGDERCRRLLQQLLKVCHSYIGLVDLLLLSATATEQPAVTDGLGPGAKTTRHTQATASYTVMHYSACINARMPSRDRSSSSSTPCWTHMQCSIGSPQLFRLLLCMLTRIHQLLL
jgi:hypothetical protein